MPHMGEMFSFTLASGIILLCLYLPYRLLLARERQHRFNRLILLGMYAAAVAMPLLKMLPPSAGTGTGSLPLSADTVAGITIGPLTGGLVEPEAPGWTRAVLWIYVAGVAVTFLRFVWAYVRLSNIIRKGSKVPMRGYTLVITGDSSFSPFSWRRYVVVGSMEEAQECNAVMVHELRHLSAGHGLDLLAAQLYAIAVWYNPVSWLMIDELKTVHEYEADEAVVDSGVDLKEYQMLLIKKTVGARLPSLANSLNHSKLKKRITMMYQSKSRTAGKLGSLMLVPALAIGMAVVSIPAVASLISDASETTLTDSPRKVTNFSADSETFQPGPSAVAGTSAPLQGVAVVAPAIADRNADSGVDAKAAGPEAAPAVEHPAAAADEKAESPAKNKEVFMAVEKQAEFPGEMAGLMKWLANNVRYPEDAQKADIQGRVIVKFIVNADGSISDPSVIKSVSPSLDQEATRVVLAMPKWQPAENGGKKVASYFHLPIAFKLTPSEPKDTVTVVSHK